VATFITRFDTQGPGLRLAVKDLIDMQGAITTAGSRAVADQAQPAEADAACMAGARAAEARGELRMVGKVNLHEMAVGATGINPWFGTPVNPVDPGLVPGGSSSGSATAVGADEADIAFGSDTAGSVRIPAACCGVVGLKTTWGRIPLEGVFPLSGELDTVGPMARDMAGIEAGMALLEPGFRAAAEPARRIGRLRLAGCDPRLDESVDRALAQAEMEVDDVVLPGWDEAQTACLMLLCLGAWENDRRWIERYPDLVGDPVTVAEVGKTVDAAAARAHRQTGQRFRAQVEELLGRVQLIAVPTLKILPAPLDSPGEQVMGLNTPAVNGAGVAALSLPVPLIGGGPVPASLQLIGGMGGEELLVATGYRIEAAVGT
jgi:amidase